jgi:hypothetical protein
MTFRSDLFVHISHVYSCSWAENHFRALYGARLMKDRTLACRTRGWGRYNIYTGQRSIITLVPRFHLSSDSCHCISVLRARHRMQLQAHSHTGLLVLCRRLSHYSQYQILVLGVRSSQAQ